MRDKPETPGIVEIDHADWSGLVEWWNDLSPPDRAELARDCDRDGHTWRSLPPPMTGVRLCLRCCSYADKE